VPGKRADKIVRKVLADGTMKEYRYSRTRLSRKRPRIEHGAIRFLAELYTRSPEFNALSATWQAAKHYYLGIIEERLDWMTLADLGKRDCRGDFYEIRDAYAATPHKADKIVDTLKALLGWAYERGHLEVNHALGIKHLASTRGTRSDIIWTEDHQAIVMASFQPSLVQAFHLALYTAARQTDLCGLRWDQYKDGWLTFQPSKTRESTGVKVCLPVTVLPPFQALLDELSKGTEFILTTEEGQPWKAENLRARWRYAKANTDLAGLDLHWHDIRGTALSRMADAGCTDSERAAISGHSIGAGTKLGDYTARSKQLAINAYAKWARRIEEGPQVVSLETALDNRRR
jgi:hypothetical protein